MQTVQDVEKFYSEQNGYTTYAVNHGDYLSVWDRIKGFIRLIFNGSEYIAIDD